MAGCNGSLDDIADILDRLKGMQVAYVLMIVRPQEALTRVWSNAYEFDADDVVDGDEVMDKAWRDYMEHKGDQDDV